ncbi:MAG: glutathione S-transferase family protein [Gammaproteobacteria bacterium]
MKIFGFPTFNLTKVLLTAEEVGQAYELVLLDPLKQELKTPENLQRHPLGKMPSLEDDGQFLCESGAICRYLALKNDVSLYAGDIMARAKIDQWMDMLSHHIGRWMQVFYWQEIVRPRFFKQESDAAALEEAQRFLKDVLPVLDNQLSDHAFITGDSLSIADTFGFPYFSFLSEVSVSVAAYPNITRWVEEMAARPAYHRVLARYPQ